MSMLRCIVTEWGSNAQTNFYIPHEYYSGYSYLFQDSEHSAWHSIESRFASPIHSNTRSNIRELRHTFVHAEEHKLHRFNHDVHNVRAKSSMHLPNMMASSTTSPMTFISLKNESFQFALHNPDHSSSIISHSGHVAEFKPAQMTIPYIHPQLNVPVPPLHLPWYCGALCCRNKYYCVYDCILQDLAMKTVFSYTSLSSSCSDHRPVVRQLGPLLRLQRIILFKEPN